MNVRYFSPVSQRYPILLFLLLLTWLAAGPAFWPSFFREFVHAEVHYSFSYLCHQLPSRCLVIGDFTSNVCARCLGIYSGLTLGWGGVVMLFAAKMSLPAVLARQSGWILLAAILFQVIDILGSLMLFWSNFGISRLFLGALLGFSVILFLFDLLEQEHKTLSNIKTG